MVSLKTEEPINPSKTITISKSKLNLDKNLPKTLGKRNKRSSPVDSEASYPLSDSEEATSSVPVPIKRQSSAILKKPVIKEEEKRHVYENFVKFEYTSKDITEGRQGFEETR